MLVIFPYHDERKLETRINNTESHSLLIKRTLNNSYIKEEIKLNDKLPRN